MTGMVTHLKKISEVWLVNFALLVICVLDESRFLHVSVTKQCKAFSCETCVRCTLSVSISYKSFMFHFVDEVYLLLSILLQSIVSRYKITKRSGFVNTYSMGSKR